MPSISCHALLFDLDGVLVDSTECVTRIWRHWAQVNSLNPEEILAVAHGRRTIDTLRLVAPHLAREAEVARLAESEANDTAGVYEVPGARALLQSLPPTAWAVITAGLRRVATLRLRHTNLPEPLVLITAEDLHHGKPDPEGYLAAAARLDVRPKDCVVVEDAPAGLDAARAAGMRAIALTTTHSAEQLMVANWGLRFLSQLHAIHSGGELRLELHDPLWATDNVAA
jgi:mannitol-1-/sugar-/sorbitol-6-phosphatase